MTGAAPARLITTVMAGGFEGFSGSPPGGGIRIPEDIAELAEIGARLNKELTRPPLR